MKTKRHHRRLVTSSPNTRHVGADVSRLRGKKQDASLVTSTLTRAELRRAARAFAVSLPTPIERDTLLVPEWIAESVVQEVERYLDARLPDGFADRLAARAHHLYPRHRHFRQTLQRPGNNGRENLFMFMRHWTCGWLKRERSPLFKKLPWSYGQGLPLPG